MRFLSFLIILLQFLTGCSLAPDYERPEMDIPDNYKETHGDWVPANPELAEIERGKWWQIYADPMLNNLQEQLTVDNQDLKAAVARYDQARAQADAAYSFYFPTIDAAAIPSRQHSSSTVANPNPHLQANNFLVGLNLAYELDVWGRVRNAAASAEDLAQASAADLAFIDLSLRAQLANYYFALRGADLAQDALDRMVIAYEKILYFNRQRFEGGAEPVEVVYQAQTQLEEAKTQATDMLLLRAQYEHAIAVLIGKAPAAFSLPVDPDYQVELIRVQPDLPSVLLQRRPDIAAAEWRVQSANAEIGVARAAFFPQFYITSSLGFSSKTLADLISRPNLVWSLGPTYQGNSFAIPPVEQVVFDGGYIEAQSDEAWASYNEIVANYRQTVLTALQEVEDSLVALHRLEQENLTQSSASEFALKAEEQAFYRYREGLNTYLDVAVTQTRAQQVELSAIEIRTRYQQQSVQLILALGGDW